MPWVTPGILPFALRASLRLFKVAPGDFVEPLDFISRLAALVPKPRVNLTRYHGVFAPNSQHRALVTPARGGRGSKAKASRPEDATPVASHAAMNWAQRLKRVFDIDIDIETCRVCGGAVKVIAAIEDPVVIKRILTHLRAKGLYLAAEQGATAARIVQLRTSFKTHFAATLTDAAGCRSVR